MLPNGYGSKPKVLYLFSRDYHLFKRLLRSFKGHRGLEGF